MNKESELLHNSRAFSERLTELNQILVSDPVLGACRMDLDHPDVKPFMRSYQYSVGHWPVIVSREQIAEFDAFIKQLPRLIFKAIDLLFADDAEYFSRYVNQPPVLHELYQKGILKASDLLIRHDLIFSKQQFKLLEINTGSALGGWQMDWLEDRYRVLLDQHDELSAWRLDYRNATDAMFRSLCQQIVQIHGDNASGRILVYTSDKEEAGFKRDFEASLQEVYQTIKPAHWTAGRLIYFHDFQRLQFTTDDGVQYDGETVDAALLTLPPGVVLPDTVNLRLVSAYLNQQIVLPDSPLHGLIGNKHLMALLHEPELQQHFDPIEKRLIAEHIPWTVNTTVKRVNWQGEEYVLQDLLLQNKDAFVLKKSNSYQGRDVIVGCFTEVTEWDSLVREKVVEAGWLVQEYCKPDLQTLYHPDYGLQPHETVWGIYGFNDRYSGAFVRAILATDTAGVINSANGATEMSVFEEAAQKKAIIL